VFRAIRLLRRFEIWALGVATLVVIGVGALSEVVLLRSHTDLVRVGRRNKIRNVPWLPSRNVTLPSDGGDVGDCGKCIVSIEYKQPNGYRQGYASLPCLRGSAVSCY
jgi:hypothetical protein